MRGSTQIITGGSATFATLTGVPGDNVALAAALAAKLDKAGGTMTGALVINAGTATASANPLAITQTWNNAAVSFQGPKITITDTASSATEQYFGIYAGASGTTKVFGVEKVGGGITIEIPGARSTSNTWSLDFYELGLALGSARKVSWSSTVNYYDSKDVVLCRAAAATLQLGDNHATTATNQTIKAHNVTTGTGADLILQGGTGSVANGYVRFGTRSAIGAETVTGYITIKDEGGTLRKLAVVS